MGRLLDFQPPVVYSLTAATLPEVSVTLRWRPDSTWRNSFRDQEDDQMRRGVIGAVALTAMLWLPVAVSAQFGHPLKGQWSGEWGPRNSPNRLLLDLEWDGKAITGVINPGPDAATVRTVTIDYSNPSSWVVKMEAEGKDASGKPVPIRVDGRLENIGAYYRIFHGTWTQGGQKGEFTVTRN